MVERRVQTCYFCTRPIPPQDIVDHMNTCSEANTCQYCSGRVPVRLFKGHLAVCDSAPVKRARFTSRMDSVVCLLCNQTMSFPNLSTHLAIHDDHLQLRGVVNFTFTPACVICYENYKEDDVLCVLRCSHVFHSNCLSRWAATESTCPNCRAAIS